MAANGLHDDGLMSPRIIRDNKARDEHIRPNNSICISGTEIVQDYGDGVEAYFQYCRVLSAVNFITMIIQIVFYAVLLSKERTTLNLQSPLHVLFISTFTSKAYNAWLGVNITCFVLSALTLPAVLWQKNRQISKHQGIVFRAGLRTIQYDGIHKDVIIRYTNTGMIDVSAHYRTFWDKILRIALSMTVFLALLAVQVIFSYYITQADQHSSNVGVSLAIAVMVSVLNFVYTSIADTLTELEKPLTLRAYKLNVTLKLLLFRLCNVISVYAAKSYANQNICAYSVIGQQFFSILVVDITVSNLIELISYPILIRLRRYQARRNKRSLQSDQDVLPPFDISFEYLDIIYRQYIAYMAMTVFPLGQTLSWLAHNVEYWMDKFKLTKVAGKPKRIEYSLESQGLMVMGLQFLSLIAAFLTPYAGVLWVLIGSTANASSQPCAFPG